MAQCKKVALLVGCTYINSGLDKLEGCHDDVRNMRRLLMTMFGFDSNSIHVMIDQIGGRTTDMPTGANIKDALKRMVREARAGDVLLRPVLSVRTGLNVGFGVHFRTLFGSEASLLFMLPRDQFPRPIRGFCVRHRQIRPGPTTNRDIAMMARRFLLNQNQSIHDQHPCLYH